MLFLGKVQNILSGKKIENVNSISSLVIIVRMESCYYTVNGLRIHVRVSKEAFQLLDPCTHCVNEERLKLPLMQNRPIVVLVHGLVVASTYMELLATHLAPWCPVFVPDLPGISFFCNGLC